MTDEHTVAIVSTEGAIKREIKRLRTRLVQDERLSEFKLEITASGRVHDGEVKLTYGLCASTFGSDRVEGDSLTAVVDEFERRRGWKERHAPKALSYDRIPSDDTEEV